MSVRRRRDNRWFFRRVVRFPDGTRRRIFGVPADYGLSNTRVGAETAEAKAVAACLATGSHKVLRIAPPSPTLRSFVPKFMESSEAKNKHSSVDSKRQILETHILPALGDRMLAEIDYAAIEDFKLALLRKLKAKTVNNVLTVLRALLATAKKRGVIAEIPEIEWLEIDRQSFDFLNFEEADRMIAAADGEWRCMVLLAIRTGMRLGELLGLRWEDVDLKAGKIHVRQAIVRGKVTTPKNRKAREIPLSPQALDALKAHRHLRGEHVFCYEDGTRLTKGGCKHTPYRACRVAGLRRIGWHVLRHTFASHLAMRGVPLRTIMELMGHGSITMTMRYAHLAPEVSRDAVALLDGGVAPTWHQPSKRGPSRRNNVETPGVEPGGSQGITRLPVRRLSRREGK